MKLLQHRIAQSRLSLPVTALYALLVWIASGLLAGQWWLQLGCFAVTLYLMILLNNVNALIRVFSRMVGCSFLVLSCCACFLFPSVRGAVVSVCIAAAWLALSQTYQDKQSAGMTYYAFLLVALASLAYVQVLFFVPLLWLLMLTQLLSLSWRTWFASLIGLATPYWFALCWLFYSHDFTMVQTHIAALTDFRYPIDYSVLTMAEKAVYGFVVALTVLSTLHILYDSRNDKIRIRLLYGFMIWVDIVALAAIALQPHHYDMLMRIAVVCTAPLVGHFLALTTSRLSNILSMVIVATAVALTAFSLWAR